MNDLMADNRTFLVTGPFLRSVSMCCKNATTRWAMLTAPDPTEAEDQLRRATYSGRPFGESEFVEHLSGKFQRRWRQPASQAPALDDTAVA